MKNFELERDENTLVAYWNTPDRTMNIIDDTFMDDLDDLINQAVADKDITGVVIASKKKDFSGGADLSMLENSKRQYEQSLKTEGDEVAMQNFFDHSSRLSRIYRKLETCSKPFAAVIHGVCLGGAFELVLACHYRIMLNDKKTKVGLPEVKVGLFPGAGGTQRVARLMETDKALQFMLKGNPISAEKALNMNLVHEIYSSGNPITLAKLWIENESTSVAPWDKKDFKNPSGKVFSPKGMMVWPAANALYRKETYNNYPGARAILTAVYEGLQVSMDTGLRIESRLFANILRSKEAEAMIRSLFLSKNELDKGARRPANFPDTNIKKVGVIGAGLMGAGIAYVSAQNGLDVVLIDTSEEKIHAGKDTITKLVDGQVSRGKMTEDEKNTLLNRIEGTMYYQSLRDVDLVIEAVFEDRDVKSKVLETVKEVVGLDTIIASNTSTLPITSLAENVTDPGKFIGIHFFSPVDKMMLVEVIKGKETDDLAVATALDFIRIIKKTPIVVNDSRGFYANRCVLNYVLEGHLMLEEGMPPAMIENVAKMAGMPVGPLALNDEVGLDLGWKILQATKKDLGPDAVNPVQEDLLHYMVEEHGRLGKKNGKGFYDYADGKKTLWSGLNNKYGILVSDLVDIEELKNRFLFTQSLEALKTMQEGIVTDQREADVGSIFGFGFPPFTGGTVSFVKYIGKDKFVQIANKLEQKFGSRFAVGELTRVIDSI